MASRLKLAAARRMGDGTVKNDSQPLLGKLDKAQLAALIEASKLLNGTLDRDEVLRRLMALAARGANADRATLYLLDESRRELRSIVALGDDDRLREVRLPLELELEKGEEEGLAGYVARTGETVNVADAYADPRFSRRTDDETGYRTRTVLAVPLRDPQGRIGGVVQVLNRRQGLFSDEDERYLLALAEHAALALENARLHAVLTAECQRLSFLYRISSLVTGAAASAELRLRDVLLTVMEGITEVLGAESSAILLWDRRRRRLVFVTVAGPKERELMEIDVPLEGSIAGWIVQHEEPVIVNDVQRDPRFFPGADARTGRATRTLIGAPVKVRGKVIGVLEAVNKRGGAPFDEADLQLAQAVADHAALAIERARHYESLLRVGEHQERRATAGFLDSFRLLRG
jgi:GAF domain-containing protein